MNHITEIITLACAIIGVIVAIATYKRTFQKNSIQDIKYLTSRYILAKSLTEKVLLSLDQYASIHGAYNNHFMQGITFGKSINLLKDIKSEIFTPEIDMLLGEKGILNKYDKSEENLLKTIDIHIKHICEVQTFFNFYFEDENKGLII
ncbi:hypothetical protein HCX49_08360 [Sphingobacterium kitahiroshimense]|uniref:hypothetical protein n=1 Tax=Sphingobacterium sp. B16(2022) TaxID=2914044 RepID=UPI00143BA693|nr:hypothetical protein [Sphingobacterium sp. B16(2022)]NJI73216.1 hypothetical protein [Sphingobacterium sp. B16(2022)]